MRLVILSVLFAGFAAAQTKPITIKFGEPNVWSLDQAHYLLEQRFQKNFTLEATRPTGDDLNANAVNGNKIKAISTLIQAGANFDQSVGRNNELAQRRMAEDEGFRRDRLQQLQRSFDKQAQISADMNTIAQDSASYFTKADGTKDMTPEAKAKTAALTIQLDTEKRRGELIKSQLSDSVPTTLQKVDVPDKGTPLPRALDTTLKDKFAFGDPKLAASNAVDNFINLQNEMIMKQVTLLRNETAYGRRIVFAELPQSFEVEGLRWYRHASENKLVQTVWRLAGYLFIPAEKKQKLLSQNWLPPTRSQVIQQTQKLRGIIAGDSTGEVMASADYRAEPVQAKTVTKTRDSAKQPQQFSDPAEGALRAIELVPRQSSLNINDRHYANTSFNLFGLFRLLSGLGVNVSYQRQKEAYEQYITQDIYATSFGKGLDTFGWVFGAEPGTRTVKAGQRTTYAIFSVPADAISIVLHAKACVFDRRDSLHENTDCDVEQEFVVPIPSEFDSGFFVNTINYAPVVAGTRQVVYLGGEHFSSLTGVTVNGVPLRRAVSIAAPELTPPSPVANGESGIVGEYSLIGTRGLAMTFHMPAGYAGTPNIGLITPVKARYINDLHENIEIYVGRKSYKHQALNDPLVFPMFYARPEIKSVKVHDGVVEVEGSSLSLRGTADANRWVRYLWNDKEAPVQRPTNVSVSHDGFTDRVILMVPEADTRTGTRADLRMEFIDELGIAPVRYVTANPGAFAVTNGAIAKFVPAATGASRADALIVIEGTTFPRQLVLLLEYNDGSSEQVTPRTTSDGKLIAGIHPPKGGGFAVFTVKDKNNDERTASGSVPIPAPPKDQEPDFIDKERIIKQVKAPKTDEKK